MAGDELKIEAFLTSLAVQANAARCINSVKKYNWFWNWTSYYQLCEDSR